MPQLAQHLKWTYEDFLLFPDDGKRHELIDGEHIMSPSPFTKHQRILVNLTIVIGTFLRQHRIGQMFVAPMDVVLSDTDVVEPDLLFIASEHASIITEKHIMGVPDLEQPWGSGLFSCHCGFVVLHFFHGSPITDRVPWRSLPYHFPWQ